MGDSKTKYVTKFIYKNLNLENINNYNDVKEHFKNFRIERKYNKFLKSKKNINSVSFLNFSLHNHENLDFLNLFTIKIYYYRKTKNKKYAYNFKKDVEEDFLKYLEENKNKNTLYISVEMETKFPNDTDSDSESDYDIDGNNSYDDNSFLGLAYGYNEGYSLSREEEEYILFKD